MGTITRNAMIETGLRSADSIMMDEDNIWSHYSNDKVDIGERLARVIRTLSAALPLTKKMRALSIGSSNEPQFRILETAFRGGLYLFDIEPAALQSVNNRILRQNTDHVTTIAGDYKEAFLDQHSTKLFLQEKLHNRRLELVTLHHSLYYSSENSWLHLFEQIHNTLLAPTGAIHAVLMAASSKNRMTTTWLYNHFAGKYFGVHNEQSFPVLKQELEHSPIVHDTQIMISDSHISFFVDDFERFMKVIWMILLYPSVHKYSETQKEEIVSFVYDNFFARKQPLLQKQHHLVLYKGIDFKGLI